MVFWKRTHQPSYSRVGPGGPPAPCRVFEYDHLAMLAAIDQADEDAVQAIASLRRPDAKRDPLHVEKVAYLQGEDPALTSG